MKLRLLVKATVGCLGLLFIVGVAAAHPLAHQRIVAGDYAFCWAGWKSRRWSG